MTVAEIGAQQVATFAATGFPEFFSVEPKAKDGGFILGFSFGKIEVKEAPGGAIARSCLRQSARNRLSLR